MKLSEIVSAYMADLPMGIVLSEVTIMRCLRQAVRFYCGYATLKSALPADADDDPLTAPFHTAIDHTNTATGAQDFDLDASELAIIRPLFDLYVERENAMALEASRGMGVDVFGRSVSEIRQDINAKEQAIPREAFMEPPFTV